MIESKKKISVVLLSLSVIFLLITPSVAAFHAILPSQSEANAVMDPDENRSSTEERTKVDTGPPSEKTEDISDNEYEERDPIHIEGNEDFANQAEENDWPGDGTEEDPYIIEGYRIDGGEDEAISISKVDDLFKIRENLIEGENRGIYLSNTENSIIEENQVKNFQSDHTSSGIIISSSREIIIQNNTVTSNRYHGIGLLGCLNSTIRNNVLRDNRGGIYLENSENSTILKNRVLNGSTGLKFYFSDRNTAVQNHFSDNEHYGVDISVSVGNQITENTIFNNGLYGLEVAVEPGPTTSRDNMIYNNNIIENDQQAVNRGDNHYYNETDSMGNYWSDYEERYPDAEKDNGYWDTPYEDDEEGDGFVDEYPLVEPSVTYIEIQNPEDGAVIEDTELTVNWTGTYRYEDELEYEVRLDEGGWEQIGEETQYDLRFSRSGYHSFEVRASNVEVDSVGGTVDFSVDLEYDIQVEDFEVEPLEGTRPLAVNITAELENVGDAEGDISLYIAHEAFRNWTLEAGDRVSVEESYEFDTSGTYEIVLGDKSTDVTVREPGPYELTVTIEGGGEVEMEPEEEYEDGTEVILTAVPEDGWNFQGWTGDHEGDDENITVIMDEDKELTAKFVEVFTLTVDIEGEGEVEMEPEEEEYENGTEVTLTAVPEDGWDFQGWTGDFEGDEENITVIMDEDKELTAKFEEDTPGFTLVLFILAVITAAAIYCKKKR